MNAFISSSPFAQLFYQTRLCHPFPTQPNIARRLCIFVLLSHKATLPDTSLLFTHLLMSVALSDREQLRLFAAQLRQLSGFCNATVSRTGLKYITRTNNSRWPSLPNPHFSANFPKRLETKFTPLSSPAKPYTVLLAMVLDRPAFDLPACRSGLKQSLYF